MDFETNTGQIFKNILQYLDKFGQVRNIHWITLNCNLINPINIINMVEQKNTVEPVFLKDKDMPVHTISPMTVVKAVTEVISHQHLEGVQKFMGVWRIYFKTLQSREDFLAQQTISISGKEVYLHALYPEETTHKLVIKGLPLCVKNKDIKSFLMSKGIKPSSQIMFSLIRDENGAFTKFKDGDRFVYCYPLDTQIPRRQTILEHPCLLHHHESPRSMFQRYKASEQLLEMREESISVPVETVDPTKSVDMDDNSNPCLTDDKKENKEDLEKDTPTTDPDVSDNQILPTAKLTIKNLPMSVPNKKLRKSLLKKNIKLSSEIKYSYIRDQNGVLTTFKDGDRYAYYHHTDTPILPQQTILGHNCVLQTSVD